MPIQSRFCLAIDGYVDKFDQVVVVVMKSSLEILSRFFGSTLGEIPFFKSVLQLFSHLNFSLKESFLRAKLYTYTKYSQSHISTYTHTYLTLEQNLLTSQTYWNIFYGLFNMII